MTRRAPTASFVLAAGAAALGVVVLAGWQLAAERIIRAAPGLPAMNPVAAGSFVLAGMSLVMLLLARDSKPLRVLGAGCAGLMTLLAFGRLAEYVFPLTLGIDSMLFPGLVAAGDSQVGAWTALGFLALGMAITLAYGRAGARLGGLIQGAALAAGVLAFLNLIGYLFGAGSLHGSIALHTAAGQLALSAAVLLLFPDRGLAGALRSAGPAGTLLRRLLPAVVVVPLLLGWLRIFGQRAGLFGFEMGTALVTVSTIVALAGLAWWGAVALESAEARRSTTEATLRESEERSRLIFENIPIPAWVYDLETLAFLGVNDAAVETYGYQRDEFLTMTIKDIRPPEDVPALLDTISRVDGAEHSDGLWRHRTHDGRLIQVQITSHPLAFDGRSAELVLAQDVTERNRVEAALRASEERFRTLATTANDAIVSADSRGRITYLNSAAERLFGYPSAEAVGEPLTILMPERFQEAHSMGLERYNRTGEARVVGTTIELVGRRKDGSEFPMELSLAAWSRGSRNEFTGIIRDISDRKRSEEMLRHYAGQLEAANAELDAFAYSVSHDLRAPLRTIQGFGQALLEDCGDRLDELGREHLQRIQKGAQRMAALIDDLLELSRVTRASLRSEHVDLSGLAETILAELIEGDPDRSVRVSVMPGAVATGDPRLLKVVLDNILGNAWKYTRTKPEAHIEFGVSHEGSAPIYYVRDNGVGFDMAYVDKLFQPFQRLHSAAEFEGTGVGLASVHRIVTRHGGRVWAEGAENRGATVYFTL
ncbi:MAG TPA: PAS domain S-box protein [Gemmatimonadota bacterium]|nr:PAS domain S-box protein [Gemmatimonadota bacterium]